MPFSLHGIGVSRGYAIGKTAVLRRDEPEVAEYAIPRPLIEDEIKRLLRALELAKRELRDIRDRIPSSAPHDISAFIDTHILMLEDATLTEAPIRLIRSQQCNAEWALKVQRDLIVQVFDEMDDPYLRTRQDDVDHVVRRIQRILLAEDDGGAATGRLEGRVVVADDLSPADTIVMQHQGIAAFVTEYGGPLSHTAILARSLGIPAVVGARHARRYLLDDEPVVVDGSNGAVLGELDESILAYYRDKQQQDERTRRELNKLKRQAAVTRDAVAISLEANIELPEDTVGVRRVGADGVGLYRTEFLFMNRADAPDEEEHLASYLHVIKSLGRRPITIRTADLGSDKQVDGGRSAGPMANNPALGLRGIRLCLKERELFKPQLRAILRASAFGPVRLMIPMLSSIQELAQVRRLVDEVKQELRSADLPFDEGMAVGGMIEVPAAAICAPYFARGLDFLSIGTNDLIQYCLAIDRVDDEVNYLYDPLHPAVLRLIDQIIKAGQKAGVPVSMCGEMAGDPSYTRLLLGLGLTSFSMHPSNLLEVKRAVLESDASELRARVHRALNTADPEKSARLLAALTA